MVIEEARFHDKIRECFQRLCAKIKSLMPLTDVVIAILNQIPDKPKLNLLNLP